jgi:hypothetical protein
MAGNFADKWRVPLRKSATWDRQLYLPSEGRHAKDFIALKNPTASAGFEPANLGTRGQHANPQTTEAETIDRDSISFVQFTVLTVHHTH